MSVTLFFFFAQGHVNDILSEYFSSHLDYVKRDPILFGDYRAALKPDQVRAYEDIEDYDAAKKLFEEVSCALLSILLLQLSFLAAPAVPFSSPKCISPHSLVTFLTLLLSLPFFLSLFCSYSHLCLLYLPNTLTPHLMQ